MTSTSSNPSAPAPTAPLIDRLAVIGCGLIGSSVIRATRARGAAAEIAVYDLSPVVRERVVALGLADAVFDDAAKAVAGADLVIFATPPAAIGVVAAQAARGFASGAIISDVGSVKAAVGEALRAACPDTVFVIPGHPIAGTEQSGPDAGLAGLFENRFTILCPQETDDAAYGAAVERLSAFWAALGAKVALVCVLIEVAGLLLIWQANSPIIAYAGAALAGFGYSLAFPGFGVEAVRRAPPQSRGAAMGAFVAFFDIAAGLTGPAAGAIAGAAGVNAVYLAGAGGVLLSSFVAGYLMANKPA